MSKILILVLLLLIETESLKSQDFKYNNGYSATFKSQYDTINADSAWSQKPDFSKMSKGISGNSKNREEFSRYIAQAETFARQTRDWGLSFWYNFPNDPRRFKALNEALFANVKFWVDVPSASISYSQKGGSIAAIPVNLPELTRWNAIYPKLRSQYLNATDLSEKEKLIFEKTEVFAFLGRQMNPAYRQYQPLDLSYFFGLLQQGFRATIKLDSTNIRNPIGPGNLLNVLESLFSFREGYGLTNEDVFNFLKRASSSEIEPLRFWANQKKAIWELKLKPFELVAKDIKGKTIDLKDYRGKIVLLDFWATWCHTCIAKMPTFKKMLEKYKDDGFEVISISADFETDVDRVLRVKNKIGADWPTLIIGGKDKTANNTSLLKKIWDKYGFSSVPQLMLLDRNGLLIEYNSSLLSSNEATIDKLLNSSLK